MLRIWRGTDSRAHICVGGRPVVGGRLGGVLPHPLACIWTQGSSRDGTRTGMLIKPLRQIFDAGLTGRGEPGGSRSCRIVFEGTRDGAKVWPRQIATDR